MGFDVLYLPPIHPIGRERRKGRNNAVTASRDDVGSPWAIGAAEGGHTAILAGARHARRLPAPGRGRPHARHRDRARHRVPVRARSSVREGASGVVPLAPRRHRAVRREPAEEIPGHLSVRLRERRLAGAVGGAAARVRVLDRRRACASSASTTRTPSRSRFWEWVIAELKREHPDVIFLSEAFTRPQVMHRLAQARASRSRTRTSRGATPGRSSPSTSPSSRTGPRASTSAPTAGRTRRTSCPYQLQRRRPRRVHAAARAGGDARRQLRHLRAGVRAAWRTRRASRAARNTSTRRSTSCATGISHAPTACAAFIAHVNQIRRDNPALQSDWSLRFMRVDNAQLICYSKSRARQHAS